MKKYLLIIGFSVLFAFNGYAQESVITSGSNVTGSGGSVSFTIGQLFFNTIGSTNGSLSEGVQQPYEITIVTSIEETFGINLNVFAYPNPTTDFLVLIVEDYDKEKLLYQLFDINGRLLKVEKLIGNETKIEMQRFVPAVYLLKVLDDKKEIKTFRIIKN